jgi:hypothetical protein
MKPKYYRTVIQVEVLSEYPLNEMFQNDLAAIAYAISEGDCSGEVTVTDSSELTGEEVAEALIAQGSDPGFFMLNDDGSDMEGDNE